MFEQIVDWDDAYANRDHIDNPDQYYQRWEELAPAFVESWGKKSGQVELDIAYGEHEREKLDLFHPEGEAKGLFMFVHGGYWVALDKSKWSHLAKVALNKGWAVAMPSYTLCPENSISGITKQIGAALNVAAGKVDGPIMLSGHSAGGHLVSRMGCENAPINPEVLGRIKRIASISGLHDLRPMLRLALNDNLKLDEAEAASESPALLKPKQGLEIMCVVGGDERPEFLRQNALLANIWLGLGASTKEVVVQGKHHFDVIDELNSAEHGWINEVFN